MGTSTSPGDAKPERVPVARVMSGYFELLGPPPMLGRTFRPEENIVGNHRVAILGYALWQRQFGGDSTLVGKSVEVNGFPSYRRRHHAWGISSSTDLTTYLGTAIMLGVASMVASYLPAWRAAKVDPMIVLRGN